MKNILHQIERDLAGDLDPALGGDLPKILAIVMMSEIESFLAKVAEFQELYPE